MGRRPDVDNSSATLPGPGQYSVKDQHSSPAYTIGGRDSLQNLDSRRDIPGPVSRAVPFLRRCKQEYPFPRLGILIVIVSFLIPSFSVHRLRIMWTPICLVNSLPPTQLGSALRIL